MERDARPLNPRGTLAMHNAAIEEIHNGDEKYGIPVLMDLHTGLRKRLLVHYDDSWREQTESGQQINLPKEIQCTIKDDGCPKCHGPTRAPDGFLRPKTGQGEQRTIPIFESFYDTYNGEERDTELKSWLDHWFRTHDAGWGYQRTTFNNAVHKVAKRRHNILKKQHHGETEVYVTGSKTVVPDIVPHDLRATFATQCLRTKVNDTTIMDWCGWADAQMLDHYRGFVGDPDGTERVSYNSGGGEPSAADLIQFMAKQGMLDSDSVDEEALKALTDRF